MSTNHTPGPLTMNDLMQQLEIAKDNKNRASDYCIEMEKKSKEAMDLYYKFVLEVDRLEDKVRAARGEE